MKTLDASQEARLLGTSLGLVTLCKLTTYSDRLLELVQSTRYFSDGVRRYDWANAGTVQDFEPWLLRVESQRDTMNHLPSETPGVEGSLRRRRRIILRNYLAETGAYLYATLRAENLEHARVEIAHVLIDQGATGSSFSDLSSYTGAEQTWSFRGVVSAIGSVNEAEFALELASELPKIPWLYANVDYTNAPEDAGKRLPVVYGAANLVECIGWDVPVQTTLALACTAAQTTITLADGSLAVPEPTGAFWRNPFIIGNEQIFWQGGNGNVYTTCIRGYNGTTAAAHAIGDAVTLMPFLRTCTWILAGHPLTALRNLYVKRNDSELLVRVTSAFTTNLANTTAVPGATVATVGFTLAELALLVGTDGVFGVKFYADVDGAIAPQQYIAGYEFDEGTGWSLLNGTQTNDTAVKTEGSASQKLTSGGTVWTVIHSCNTDSANWNGYAGTVGDEAVITLAGGSLVGTCTQLVASYTGVRKQFAPASLTSKTLRVSIFCPSDLVANATTGIEIWLSSDTSNVNLECSAWRFNASQITLNAWNTFDIDPLVGAFYESPWDGGLDVGSWRIIEIRWNKTAGRFVGSKIYVDEISTGVVPTVAMQRNATAAAVSLVATSNAYKIDVRQEGMSTGDRVRVYFSNTAGVGTTKPASYWYLEFKGGWVPPGAWKTLELTAVGVGGPASPTNVETVGVELVGSSATAQVWVDNLRRQDSAAANGYLAAGGAVLTRPNDILRHLLTEFCTPVQSVDSAWDDSAGETYLDDNFHAVDLRVLGESSAEVLARLAFEARCNLLTEERTSGTVYRLLCAHGAGDFDAPTVTLDKWQELAEVGRETDSLSTRFRHLYRFDPSRGFGIDAYTSAISTTEDDAEAILGRIDAEPVALPSVWDGATAAEIALYYAQERSRVASLFVVTGVPWSLGFKLERGDIVALTPPWLGVSKKLRVIETEIRSDFLVNLRAVEVL